MLDKRIIFILIILGFFAIPFISAEDNLTLAEDVDVGVISLPDESPYSNVYFNASVENDGSGTQENPYKYLTSSRIQSNSILHLANGEYELDKSLSFSSYNAFMGEDVENTIIKYTGTVFSNSKTLELYNLTIMGASVYNKGTLTIDNVIFRDSTQDYGGAIYSISSTLNISNSRFINNTARLGGAICDLNSQVSMFNVTAINNTAIYQGGAIYKMYGALYLNSSEFLNNSANEGQAIFCDYSIFNMTSNDFINNSIYSILCDENFTDNTFNQSVLHQSDYYDINFVSQNYTPMIYVPYNGTIPSRYDLREEGFVSSVKNQGSNGNCWAFAILAVLESCILKATGIEYDFSEQNIKNLMAMYSDYGWNYSTNTGGTNGMGIAYLTSWIGAINETDDKYLINSLLSPVMDSIVHVQNIIYLPRLSYTDNDAIKQAILNYGGVYTSLYSTGATYQYYTGTNDRNHAVVIVGWDDYFSKSKFSSKPSGDGAWICKNSWGSGWGDDGYFYVSYYDTKFAKVGDLDASFTFVLNDMVKYDKIYQWEIAGVTDYFLTNQSTIWYQNYYNATSDDILAAFSTYFYMESNWTAELYVNDELKLTQNGTVPARGYYTINFDEFIPIYKNDEFKILLKVTTSDEAYVPISENNGVVSRVHFKENMSFISYDGINWIDFYSYNITMESRGHWYVSQVACIKAFTIFNLTTVMLLDILSKQENNINISATVSDQYGHLINEGYVIFELDGVKYNRSVSNGKAILSLNGLDYGYCTISAEYQNNTHYLSSSDELTFICKHDVNLTLNIEDITYGDYLKVNITLMDLNSNLINANLTLTVGDKIYNVSSNSIFIIPDLINVGDYEVKVVYDGNYTYSNGEAYANGNVKKADVNLILDVNNINYGDYLTINTTLSFNSNLINDELILCINNKNYSFTSNSEFILPVLLNASQYNIYIYYNGSENFNANNVIKEVFVSKIHPIFEVNISDINYDDDLIVYTSLIGLNGELINECLVLNINGTDYPFMANNKFILSVILNASDYTANILYDGDINYYSVNKSTDFTISKVYPVLDVNVNDIDYDENLIVYASLIGVNGGLINESVVLSVNGSDYSFMTNNEFILPVILNVSNYTANILYNGDSNYYSFNKSVNFKVYKVYPVLDVSIDDVNYGENPIVDVSFTGINGELINESVVLSVNGVDYSFMTNSEFIIPVILDVSDYTVNVFYKGDSNYYSVNESVNFTVNKNDVNINLLILNITYGEVTTVNTYLTDLYGNNLTSELLLVIDNNSFEIMSNSLYALPFILNASDYVVDLYFNGSENYNANNLSKKFLVAKSDLNMTVKIENITYGDYLIIVNTLSVDLDCDLQLEIDNKAYSLKPNSTFKMPYIINSGDYEVILAFLGNNNYNANIQKINVSVDKFMPTLITNLSDIDYGDDLIVYTSLIGINGELINESVVLRINGVDYSFISNNEFVLPVVLNADNYTANVIYYGDSNYYSSDMDINFTVFKVDSVLDVNVGDINYGDDLIVCTSLMGVNGELINESVVLSINGVDYSFIANSVYTLPVILNASDYVVNVAFNGDNNYNAFNNAVNVTVNKINLELMLNISNTPYCSDLIVKNSLIGVNGEISNETLYLTVNGKKYNLTSNMDFIIPDILDVGNYKAKIIFNGNINYKQAIDIKEFEIIPVELSMDLTISKVINNVFITVKFSNIINESISVKVNGNTYCVNIVNGEGVLSLINLDLGDYSVEALFNKTGYETIFISDYFNVSSINTLINANNVTMYYHDGTRLYFNLKDSKGHILLNKSVKININNVTYTRTTDVNGFASINLGLNSAIYLATLIFDGDDTYINSSSSVYVDIKSTIVSDDFTKYYRNSSQFYAKILDYDGNPITNTPILMNINGVFYNRTTNSEGVVRLNINLNPDEYILTIYNPATNEMGSSTIKVLSKLVENYNLVKYYKNASKYSVKVLDDVGSPLAGVSVKFNINGVFYKRTSDENGVASLAINLNPGTYIITAEYDTLKVSNSIEVLSVIKTEDVMMTYRDGTAFKAKILDGLGNANPDVSVTFNINGVFYTRTTDGRGVASLNINLQAGEYIITSNYNGLNESNTLVIKNH